MLAEAPTTRWTRIQSARGNPEKQRELWGELFRGYWRPLFVLGRRRGLSAESASDAVQSFAEKMLEAPLLDRADKERGRLRSYIAKSFEHHLSSLHVRANAEKRGGGLIRIDFDVALETVYPREANAEPLVAFDRAWAASLLEETLRSMREEYESTRTGDFALLERYLAGEELPPLAELAKTTGVTVSYLKSFLHRGRQRFRERMLALAKDTLEEGEDVEDELRRVVGSLSP